MRASLFLLLSACAAPSVEAPPPGVSFPYPIYQIGPFMVHDTYNKQPNLYDIQDQIIIALDVFAREEKLSVSSAIEELGTKVFHLFLIEDAEWCALSEKSFGHCVGYFCHKWMEVVWNKDCVADTALAHEVVHLAQYWLKRQAPNHNAKAFGAGGYVDEIRALSRSIICEKGEKK